MAIEYEQQFDLFLDIENGRDFSVYVLDKVNKVMFANVSKYMLDSVKVIGMILDNYRVENIKIYDKTFNLGYWSELIETNYYMDVELDYPIRRFRDKLRRERNPIRHKTNPVYYYEVCEKYKMISKEDYDSGDYKREKHRVWYPDMDLYTLW